MSLILTIIILIFALSIHEAAHAKVADILGDPTPKYLGRVSLNPIKHLDPMGTAVFLITAISGGPVFGWGKPVVFNPANLKNPKRDAGLVALAGPASNILTATITIAIVPFINIVLIQGVLVQFVILNVILAVFNLIPIYPLDGFNIVAGFLPNNLSRDFSETSKYGIWILLLLILTNAISKILSPVIWFVLNIFRLMGVT